MTLTRALNIGSTGLRTSQRALAVVGHNIANIDTEGYSRQRVEIEAQYPEKIANRNSYQGMGSRVRTVTRADDQFAELQARRDKTLEGFYKGRSETLMQVERLYVDASEPDISGALDAFWNGAREVTADASERSSRLAFLNNADQVANAFNLLYQELQDLREGIDDTLTDRMDQVNEQALVVADMNARIVSGELGDREANDFRDQRDQAIREIAEYVDINVLNQPDGSVTLELQGGHALVQQHLASRLEAAPNVGNNGLDDIEYVDPNGNRKNVTATINRGEIGGLLDVRDRILVTDQAELDTLAFEFANTVNAQFAAGFGLDGVTGRNLFVPPVGAAFAAANLAVDPAVVGNADAVQASQTNATLPGDNRNFQLLSELQHVGQAALGNVSYNTRFAELVHDVGNEARTNNNRLEVQEVKAEQSELLRESVEGVNLDDEMLDLTKFQKHFEANTRIIQAVDELLDQVLSLVQ